MKVSFLISAFICILSFPVLASDKNLLGDTTRPIVTKSKSPSFVVPNSAHVDKECSKMELVVIIINDAISVGAPAYNDGNRAACYKIYEGAAYKILHKYGKKCTETSDILETALEKISGDYSVSEKAWIMRMAFDKILGVPTQTK